MKIRILLFGVLADIADKPAIEVNDAFDVNSLQGIMKNEYAAFINVHFVIAINKKIVSGNHPIQENDEVALLPPFSGG